MKYELEYEGQVDSLNKEKLSGWARQIGFLKPVHIDIFVNNKHRLKVKADVFRKDLRDRRIGKGEHGFVIPVEQMDLKRGDKVKIQIADFQFELPNSPLIYNGYETTEPWVESDLYAEHRHSFVESPFLEYADNYRRDGFIILENAIDQELVDRVIKDTKPLLSGENHYGRVMDAWQSLPSVKEIALNPQIRELLDFLYGRRSIPFQTLNFEYGTQQPAHSDSIHFSCLPARFMCGVWVALEDTTEDNGPLLYYPGSHQLKEYKYSDMGLTPKANVYGEYEKYIARLMKANNFPEKRLIVKKGDVLIWSSNLIHGGSKTNNRELTRWSQVTHYYFEDCLYYTPCFSDEISGEYVLKGVKNIATNRPVQHTYNGIQLQITKISGNLSRIKL